MKYFFSPIINGEFGKEAGFYEPETGESTLPNELVAQIQKYEREGIDTVTGGVSKDDSGKHVNYTKRSHVTTENVDDFMESVQFKLEDEYGNFYRITRKEE